MGAHTPFPVREHYNRIYWAPSPPSPAGSHLSAVGGYRDKIVQLQNKYPDLACQDRHRITYDYAFTSRVACFEFEPNSTAQRHLIPDVAALRSHLGLNATTSPGATPRRRLYIMEGANLEYVDAFGTALQMDPTLVASHNRTAFWETYHESGNNPGLPTLRDPQLSFQMRYRELLYLKAKLESFSLRCAENERHIGVSRQNGEFDNVGIIHRKASFWARRIGADGWDGEHACL